MAEPTEKTRLFNRTTQPRVIAWGEGVVMPGESFLTDSPEGYQPDVAGSPWTTDAETSAVLSVREAQTGDASDSATQGDTSPQDAAQGTVSATEGSAFHPELPLDHPHQPQGLRVEANGDVVNDAGQVVGRVEQAPTPPTADNPGGTA